MTAETKKTIEKLKRLSELLSREKWLHLDLTACRKGTSLSDAIKETDRLNSDLEKVITELDGLRDCFPEAYDNYLPKIIEMMEKHRADSVKEAINLFELERQRETDRKLQRELAEQEREMQEELIEAKNREAAYAQCLACTKRNTYCGREKGAELDCPGFSTDPYYLHRR